MTGSNPIARVRDGNVRIILITKALQALHCVCAWLQIGCYKRRQAAEEGEKRGGKEQSVTHSEGISEKTFSLPSPGPRGNMA